ncbi:MAG: hypothetical protein RLZZ56_609 [Actinomycetota bacterium]|jgi:hypothetical protein
MAKDSRVALQHFIAALENHHSVASLRRDGDDANVERAYLLLQEAFLDYEEALQDSYEELLPFELAEDEGE